MQVIIVIFIHRWTARLLPLLRTRCRAMSPRQLAGMLWSMARLGLRPDSAGGGGSGSRWMDCAMAECIRKLPEFGSQELASVIWALVRWALMALGDLLAEAEYWK